jgi:hypothetical protein
MLVPQDSAQGGPNIAAATDTSAITDIRIGLFDTVYISRINLDQRAKTQFGSRWGAEPSFTNQVGEATHPEISGART